MCGVNECKCVCMCMWRPDTDIGCLLWFPSTSPYWLEQGFFFPWFTQEITHSVILASLLISGSPGLCILRSGIKVDYQNQPEFTWLIGIWILVLTCQAIYILWIIWPVPRFWPLWSALVQRVFLLSRRGLSTIVAFVHKGLYTQVIILPLGHPITVSYYQQWFWVLPWKTFFNYIVCSWLL